MVTYAQLSQLHPSINVERRAELEALYEGGERLEKLYPRLLKQRPKEPALHWQLRIGEAEYRNYVGPIIDYFTSMLFVSSPVLKATTEGSSDSVDVGEYWEAFREDCDGGGTNIDAFFKARLTDAMVGRTGWLRPRLPSDDGPPPATRADFEKRKLGDARIEPLCADEVLDWDTGEDGRLLWAITHKREAKRAGPAGSRDIVVETWEHLTPESVNTYRLTYDEKKNKPTSETEVPQVGAEAHRFGSVPLVCLDLPPALWVANRLRSPQLAHFRKVCAQSWSLAATCYAMPVVKVEDAAEYIKQTSGAGYEIVIGQKDDYTWQAPPTGHFSSLDAEIKACKDEIFRIAHQMALGVENNAAAVGRSAESKASDAESTRVVLVAFSRLVKETMEYMLDLISRARGEAFVWSVEGLDDFAALDVGAFLEQLALLKTPVGMPPSKTFAVQVNQRVAESLMPDLDEAVKTTIRKEIEAGTTDPAVDAELDRQAARDIFAAPSGDRRPGADPPAKPPRENPDSGRPA